MRFIRNGRVKEKLVELSLKGLLIGFSALFFLWMVSGARASAPEIISIQGSDSDAGISVEFQTSTPVNKEDVSMDFQRNFIQVSFKGVSAFPAKTVKLKNSPLEKAFTYQYQPDLARARILLSTQAKKIEKGSSLEVSGDRVKITVPKKEASILSKAVDKISTKSSASEKEAVDPAEQQAREEILKSAPTLIASQKLDEAKTKVESENLPLFTAQTAAAEAKIANRSSSSKIFASLLLVLGIIGAASMAFRRFAQGKGLPFQRQNKVIEVISSQSLGPKKAVTLVKILDRHIVLGVAGESINLLLDLGTDVPLEKIMDDSPAGASFGDALSNNLRAPQGSSSLLDSVRPSESDGFRASLKKRLVGLKPL